MSDTKLEKVLIIDDNSDYRKLIKTFISNYLKKKAFEYDEESNTFLNIKSQIAIKIKRSYNTIYVTVTYPDLKTNAVLNE